MQELTIPLNLDSKTPLYEQIYSFIKEEIQKGSIPFGEKLPSTRVLSRHMKVSRSTVDAAYEQLLSEGYIESLPYVGYFVSEVEELYHLEELELEESVDQEEENIWVDFSPGNIDLTHFPYNTWRKLSKEVLSDEQDNVFRIGNAKGEPRLRETLKKYLHQSRGVNCTAGQIIVGAGNDYLLMMLRMILGENYTIAMENPTYKQAYHMFQQLDYPVRSVALDAYGMDVSELEGTDADIAYVMPSHQYPLGVVMPLKRRMELLKWAGDAPERYIIEDDHDSEFRYKGKPIPSLQGYDKNEKVIYIGTFSKSIAPSIRISYMVLPQELLRRYEENTGFLSTTVPKMDQLILNRFIGEGYYERHLNRMRAVYKSKHDAMLGMLKGWKEKCSVSGEHAGIHLLLQVDTELSEAEIIRKAKDHKIKIYGLSENYIDADFREKRTTLLIGYGNVDKEDMKPALQVLYKILFPMVRTL